MEPLLGLTPTLFVCILIPMKTFSVSLHGKWGGTRSVTVHAKTPASAKKKARELSRLDERVGDAYTVGA